MTSIAARAVQSTAMKLIWLLRLPERFGIESKVVSQLVLRLNQMNRLPSDVALTRRRADVELELRSRDYMRYVHDQIGAGRATKISLCGKRPVLRASFWNTIWLVLVC